MSSISIVIPVGPYPANKRWLDEAIESCLEQADEILLIDDGAKLDKWNDKLRSHRWRATDSRYAAQYQASVKLWNTLAVYEMPWRTGISHAFNYGVMLARNDLVFMLGSDDTLEPTCLERCLEAYEKRGRADGYYSVPIRYMDTGEVQTAPCNAAMVTKDFWRLSGGFPLETAIGIGDSTLLSICIAHNLPVYWVGHDVGDDDTPLYNYRRHPDIHTYKIPWHIADPLRSHLTATWTPEEVKQWSDKY